MLGPNDRIRPGGDEGIDPAKPGIILPKPREGRDRPIDDVEPPVAVVGRGTIGGGLRLRKAGERYEAAMGYGVAGFTPQRPIELPSVLPPVHDIIRLARLRLDLSRPGSWITPQPGVHDALALVKAHDPARLAWIDRQRRERRHPIPPNGVRSEIVADLVVGRRIV